MSEKSSKKVLTSAALGQFVEWYDFVVYAYSATVIAKLFFPNEDPSVGVLSTLAVYGAGFVMRPLGGFILGSLGDRFGRRAILSIIILSMGLATSLMGLLPTYASIGIWAPILLVILRLVQGLSAAGESAGSNSFVAEHAPKGKRGLHVAFTYAFANLPPVAAALLILLLTSVLGESTYLAWGWRIPFLLGAPLAFVGLYIRTHVDESPAFEKAKSENGISATPVREAMQTQRKPMLFCFAIAAFSSLAFYTMSGYFVTYLTTSVGLSRTDSLIANSIAMFVSFFIMIWSGHLSDLYGRKTMLCVGLVASAVAAVPAYLLASHATLITAIAGQLLLAIAMGLYSGPVGAALLELFPTRTRLSASAISYNLAYTIFGGSAPFLGAGLVLKSGSLLAPAVYMAVIAIAVLIVIMFMPETYKRSITDASPLDGNARIDRDS